MERVSISAVLPACSRFTWALTGKINTEPKRQGNDRRAAGGTEQTFRYAVLFVLPIWTIAGLSDCLWHRRTKIETTSGTKESFSHLLMMAEMAPPVLSLVFLEVNAATLAIMIASFVLHQATAVWDISFTTTRRLIATGEQHTHSFLEMVPGQTC